MNGVGPDHLVCRWPALDARGWLASFLERAEVDANVVAVIAIGSAVRPDVTSDDLDVMVVCRDVVRLKERAPIEVDLRKANWESVDDQIQAGHDLLVWAVRFGRPLLDQGGAWAEFTRRWTSRLPLPDPTVALARAEAARRRMEKVRVVGDDDAVAEVQVSYLTHRGRVFGCGGRAAGIAPGTVRATSWSWRGRAGRRSRAGCVEEGAGCECEAASVVCWRRPAVRGPIARRERATAGRCPTILLESSVSDTLLRTSRRSRRLGAVSCS